METGGRLSRSRLEVAGATAGGGRLVSQSAHRAPRGHQFLRALAFLSRGHQPGVGPYGQQLNRAIDFVVSCQKADGLFSYEKPERQYISRAASHTATYNHAIAGLMLGEVYGHVTGERARKVRAAIEKGAAIHTQPAIPSQE